MFLRKYVLGIVLILFICATASAYEFKLLSEIPVKGKISAVAVNPATDTVAAISESANSLSIINTVSSSVPLEVSLPAAPAGIAIHKGWNKAVVAANNGKLYLYDMNNGELTNSFSIDARVHTIDVYEPQNAAVLGVDGGVITLDLSSGSIISRTTFSGDAVRVVAGKAIAVAGCQEAGASKMRTIDIVKGDIIKQTTIPGSINSIAVDESLGLVLVTLSDQPGLLLYEAASLRQLGGIPTGKQAEIVSVNPSTHIAVLSDTLDASLSIISLEQKSIIETIPLFKQAGPICVDASRNRALIANGESLTQIQLENPLPSISKLAPNEASAKDNDVSICISGSKFLKESQTKFNRENLATTFENNEQLTSIIPIDKLLYPGNATVSVANPTPGGGTSNELMFRILTPAPQLSSLTPATIAEKTLPFTLRVEGKNFLPSATIAFNGKTVATRFFSSTVLEASIDSQMVSAKGAYLVTVTNIGTFNFTSNSIPIQVVGPDEAALAKKTAVAAAPQGSGSLVGRILNTEMRPLSGVTIRHKSLTAQTDDFGNFILSNLPAGKRTILIDGSTVNEPGGHFPTIPISADITADKLNPMPFTPFLHRQKSRNFVNINPAKETVLTDSEVPGFEMRIPQGVNIVGWDGQVNLKVSVRTVPTDRLPVKPLPRNSFIRTVYMFYFNKVGGGKPDQPIPIKSPNDLGLLPGEKAILWYYDESPNEGEAPNDWAIAGTGTVTPDGKYIVTDPGVGIPKFCCGATAWGGASAALPSSSKEPCGALAGDPVDVSVGYFVHEQTDLVIPGIIPVQIKRYYRSRDSGSAVSGSTGLGAFGKGAYFEYDWWLGTYGSMLRLTKPGNYQYDFALQPDGSYTNSIDPDMRGAKVTTNADNTKSLRMRDGWKYRFDASGRLIEVADRYANKISVQRHSDFEGGYISGITTAEGRVISFNQVYTGNFYRTDSVSDNNGTVVKYGYENDPFNPYPRLNLVQYPDGTFIKYGYDAQGRMNSFTNRRGIVEVVNEYDANSRVIKQTHPDGGIYTFSYTDTAGIVTQTVMTAPNSAQTIWRFNNYGYITDMTTPDGTTAYEKASGTNELLSVTDPLNRKTSYTYYATSDATNGLLKTVTDPLLNVTQYVYEPTYGLPTQITDALTKTTTFTYTPAGAPPTQVVIRNPLQNQNQQLAPTTITYNSYGMPVSITNPNGNTTNFTYDPNHHAELTGVSDQLINTTSYSYDDKGRLASVTDARKKTVATYGYDPAGRVNSITDAIGGETRFYYDGNGNLNMLIDPSKNRILYEYDSRDRITKMTDQLDHYESYAYYTGAEITPTTGDNLKSFTDRKGQTTVFGQYDPMNRLKSVSFSDGTTLQYIYDAAGRAKSITDSLAGTIALTYNDYGCTSCSGRGLDLIANETTPSGSIDYTYYANGRRKTMAVASEPLVTYEYDDAGRLSNLIRTVGTGSRTYKLEYDNGNRRTSVQIPLANAASYVSSTYGYDSADRLTSILLQGASSTIDSLIYTPDPNGNRSTLTRAAIPAPTPAIANTTYNPANQLLAYNGQTLTYDANGNLQNRIDSCGTTIYTWDGRNRLTGISGFKPDCTALTASFIYDGLNRRTSKTINGTTTQFIYDGIDIIQEVTSGVKTNYVRTLNVDEPLTRITNGDIKHYLRDGLGSIIGLTDDTGSSVATFSYDAFGNTGSSESFGYTGRENDGTGLLYYRARYYSPEIGRFISEDPIRLKGGINYFGYAQDNPVNLIDPTGLISNFLPSLPGLADRFPESRTAAISDVILGGVETGGAVVVGVASIVAYLAGPEFWPISVVGTGASVEAGWDGVNRIYSGVSKLDDLRDRAAKKKSFCDKSKVSEFDKYFFNFR